MMQDAITIAAVLISVIFAFLFGRKSNSGAEKRLKTIDRVERIERDVETQDDKALADRISRKS